MATTALVNSVQACLRWCGIDRAIFFTLAGRGWSVIAGPLTLILIGKFLRPDEQGFYYTFGSVIALNIFFELGLAYVIVQFSSHEKALLDWAGPEILTGSEVALVRLATLLQLALKWYGVAALLVLGVVLPAGLFFFSGNPGSSAVRWQGAWVWLATTSALNLLCVPLFAILEGCGKVSHVASMRAVQSVFANIALWVTLFAGGGLYGAPVFQSAMVAFGAAWALGRYRHFFSGLLRANIQSSRFDWRKEVWPFQWRIALSWLSGYVVFQMSNPVLFAFQGPVAAGQMGMSLSLCSALLTMSTSWMNTKASPFGTMVANRQWTVLNTLFDATLRQSLVVLCVACALVFAGALFLHQNRFAMAKRLVDPLPFGILLLATIMNHVLFCQSMYLRAHKKEPYLLQSVVMGVVTSIAIIFLAKNFSVAGVALGFFICCAVGALWGSLTFIKKRREWHA